MTEFAAVPQFTETEPSAEILEQLETIHTNVETVLQSVEPYEEDWGNGTVLTMKERNVTQKDGTTIYWTQGIDPKNDSNSYSSLSVHGTEVYAHIAAYNNGTYIYRTHKDDDVEDPVTLKEAVQDPRFTDVLQLLAVYAEQPVPEVVPEQHEMFYEIPQRITVTALEQEARQALAEHKERLGLVPHMTNKILPTTQLTSENGHTWIMSKVFMLGDHEAAVMYAPNEQEGTATPYVVYASRTHATWRYLPKVEVNEKGGQWFKKPLLEAAVNVPIALQKVLWQQSQGNQHPSMLTEHEQSQVSILTNITYDERTTSSNTDYIDLEAQTDPQNAPVAKQPHQQPSYTFQSRLYGQVNAYEVPSQNGDYSYLLLEEAATGKVWASVIQQTTARMKESFTMTPFVVDYESYQQPLEHATNKRHAQQESDAMYVANTPQQTPTLLAGWR